MFYTGCFTQCFTLDVLHWMFYTGGSVLPWMFYTGCFTLRAAFYTGCFTQCFTLDVLHWMFYTMFYTGCFTQCFTLDVLHWMFYTGGSVLPWMFYTGCFTLRAAFYTGCFTQCFTLDVLHWMFYTMFYTGCFTQCFTLDVLHWMFYTMFYTGCFTLGAVFYTGCFTLGAVFYTGSFTLDVLHWGQCFTLEVLHWMFYTEGSVLHWKFYTEGYVLHWMFYTEGSVLHWMFYTGCFTLDVLHWMFYTGCSSRLFDQFSSDTVYDERLLTAADNFIAAAFKLPRASGCFPPCGFQASGYVYNCITCQYDSCEFPLDCPTKNTTVMENNRTQMRCDVPFPLPYEMKVVWRFAEEVVVGHSELQEIFDLSLLPGGQIVPVPGGWSLALLRLPLPSLLTACLTSLLLLLFLSLGILHWWSIKKEKSGVEQAEDDPHSRCPVREIYLLQ
ncbi:sperm acrosome associated 6 isoform X2 [Salvelinus fontinalis]|uniref:sperm acrosome associated 6 isoform X2 n=1 Tax=Salvelinus fontinalis TaxID=8038 RepID=UPI002486372E|nr:sperm acrosome associated 6 isoform X2 [Salvelinus fontinalis]